MGAKVDLAAADLRWLTPLPLWTGILAGPIAWAFDLGVGYAVAQSSCTAGRHGVLPLITAGCLAVVAGGAVVSWLALQRTTRDDPTDGGKPRQRARFMALLGLALSALFAVQIIAAAMPRWVLHACD